MEDLQLLELPDGGTAPHARRTGSPLLSVIVPVRNDPEHLRRCLLSLQASTAVDFEILVVDDHSEDETPAVARRFAAKNAGVRLLRLERRGGPAEARNRAALLARGEILMFVDADVCVYPDTLQQVVSAFQRNPSIDAVFGSYDSRPESPNFLSQYKNLFHHFVHQQGRRESSTFWSGCGAVRSDVFVQAGGFDTSYRRPCIEDIELGTRLKRAGRRIVLSKNLQVTHLKHWTLSGIVKSDMFDRAIPWTELMLRDRRMPNDLNLKLSQRLCVLLSCVLMVLLAWGAWFAPSLLLLPLIGLAAVIAVDRGPATRWLTAAAAGTAILTAAGIAVPAARLLPATALIASGVLAVVVAINARFYAFFAKERSCFFAVLVVPVHLTYYVYGALSLIIGVCRHFRIQGSGFRGQGRGISLNPES